MRRWGVLVLLSALLCAGCKVEASTTIHLNSDGSGVVTVQVRLDREAVRIVQRGGGRVSDRIVLDDLRAAGWKIEPWVLLGGGATLRMSHTFKDDDDLASLLADLTGSDGVLRDSHLTRTRNALQQRDGVSVVADLTALKTGVRDDKALAAKLKTAGVNVDAVDFVLAQQLRRAFRLQVVLEVPRGKSRTFAVPAGERETVNLTSSKFETNRFMLLVIGSILVFLALLLYLSASISARRRRARALEFAVSRAQRREPPLM
jgi:hypothetical protein